MTIAPTARFTVGQMIIAPTARKILSPEDIITALLRHVTGDWGDVDMLHWQENRLALQHAHRPITSIYETRSGVLFGIITEPLSSFTVVAVPGHDASLFLP